MPNWHAMAKQAAIPICKTEEQFKMYRRLWRKVPRFDEQELYKVSGCLPACKITRFKTRFGLSECAQGKKFNV